MPKQGEIITGKTPTRRFISRNKNECQVAYIFICSFQKNLRDGYYRKLPYKTIHSSLHSTVLQDPVEFDHNYNSNNNRHFTYVGLPRVIIFSVHNLD